jgi:hypothetical protein
MNTASSIFLLVGATAFAIFFGLPLFISPLYWARRIGWRIPEDRDLVNYLGRSLGGGILPIIIIAYLAASDPWKYRFIFQLVILIGIFMVAVHVYGFIKRTQPLVEHLEIILYSLLSILAWYFYPQPPV